MVRRTSAPPPNRPRTLGPVADLERHLPADWWRRLFNALYVKTDGDVVENAANTTFDVDLLIAATQIAPGDHVLDLCCGQGRHSLELARRGFQHVAGLDCSHYLVQLARRRARTAGLAVRFRRGDARAISTPDGPFDCVAILGNSFGYFEDPADDGAVLAAVRAALRPGGVLAMDVTDGDWVRAHFEPRSWEWIDRELFVCRERSLSADGTRLICREVVAHAHRGVMVDQFYAERLYSRAQLHALLRSAGFAQVQDHGAIRSDSERNQDLGMMAHRFFVTGRTGAAQLVVKRAAPAAAPRFSDITVLLGDPRLRDPVKRGGRFQPEDLDTVRRLQAALGGLREYRFHYLDCHATLAADLERTHPAFVLNFCDEGFANDARRELHVPALLELLGIPYSGADPVCLGFCHNKSLVAAAAAALGIPVPRETYLTPDTPLDTAAGDFPLLVKPVCGDGSVGITAGSVARTPVDLAATITRLREDLPGQALLVQEFLEGPEYTVGILGNPAPGLHVLPLLSPDYSRLPPELPRILGYESKWLPDSPYWTEISYGDAVLPVEEHRRVCEYSMRLFARLGCRDYSRFDFRAGADGNIKLLEINPNPGWCWDGKLALMADLAGWSYADLLRRILEIAQARLRASPARNAPLPGDEPMAPPPAPAGRRAPASGGP
jgi:D-alanine-D-alanine ligase